MSTSVVVGYLNVLSLMRKEQREMFLIDIESFQILE